MYAPKHPWFTAVAGLGLALGLATAMDTSAPALRLASDAVVMPSAAPLPQTPAKPATSTLSDAPPAPAVADPAQADSTGADSARADSAGADSAQADPALAESAGADSALADEESPTSGLTDEAEPGSVMGGANPDIAEAPMAGPVQPGRDREPEPVTVGGTLLVPTEIQPGTYQSTVPEDSDYCYWTRLRGTSGEADDIIAGDFVNPGERVTVTISEDDAAFFHTGCGTLTQ
ncbi:hypothetical protein [Phytohabitans aurantiacus]|uniref:Uncharacterized protein n=1 Tax=Phytohabitans aurantiacus TaxID=3016789 RepID=A0ABQ5QX40_9ACTN|nr:hypothetical protein [Phytohabitans aurantiacus]GLH99093.1 hypothetical protein Pa4123_43680 [Phytohabitans aurantiacus]